MFEDQDQSCLRRFLSPGHQHLPRVFTHTLGRGNRNQLLTQCQLSTKLSHRLIWAPLGFTGGLCCGCCCLPKPYRPTLVSQRDQFFNTALQLEPSYIEWPRGGFPRSRLASGLVPSCGELGQTHGLGRPLVR